MKYSLYDFIQLRKGFKNEIKVNIISGSLEPWIYTGEKVTVVPCHPNEIKALDIIVFWKDEKLICHIYRKTLNKYLITQALVNKKYDTPTDSKYLLGKVISPKFSWYHRLMFKYLK
jgi:hypothetical protein